MENQQGFTLIELMIAAAFIGIVVSVAIPAINGNSSAGFSEFECIDGLKFTREYDDGDLHQVIGPNGGGVSCQ